jgi:DamX protein
MVMLRARLRKRKRQTAAATRPERKQAVIEPKSKPQTTVKARREAETCCSRNQPKRADYHNQSACGTATPKATAEPKATTTAPARPHACANCDSSNGSTAAGGAKSAGNVGSMKSAPSSNYTLQLSSSSNYDNLNSWAKKENLKNYVVYQTTRNGQPWYVLVSGVYASKDEAKRAVSTLPADVQAKNPWAKPLHQVQADLK